MKGLLLTCIICIIGLAVAFAAPAMAADFEYCGNNPLPLRMANGNDSFVPMETFLAAGGNPDSPVQWTGDKNGWGLTEVKPYTLEGVEGYLVEGHGPEGFRWNLVQKENPRFYLRIETAHRGFQNCEAIHKPGEARNGKSYPDSLGIAYW